MKVSEQTAPAAEATKTETGKTETSETGKSQIKALETEILETSNTALLSISTDSTDDVGCDTVRYAATTGNEEEEDFRFDFDMEEEETVFDDKEESTEISSDNNLDAEIVGEASVEPVSEEVTDVANEKDEICLELEAKAEDIKSWNENEDKYICRNNELASIDDTASSNSVQTTVETKSDKSTKKRKLSTSSEDKKRKLSPSTEDTKKRKISLSPEKSHKKYKEPSQHTRVASSVVVVCKTNNKRELPSDSKYKRKHRNANDTDKNSNDSRRNFSEYNKCAKIDDHNRSNYEEYKNDYTGKNYSDTRRNSSEYNSKRASSDEHKRAHYGEYNNSGEHKSSTSSLTKYANSSENNKYDNSSSGYNRASYDDHRSDYTRATSNDSKSDFSENKRSDRYQSAFKQTPCRVRSSVYGNSNSNRTFSRRTNFGRSSYVSPATRRYNNSYNSSYNRNSYSCGRASSAVRSNDKSPKKCDPPIQPYVTDYQYKQATSQFDEDLQHAFHSVLHHRCSSEVLQKNENTYGVVANSFYDNMVNLLETFANVPLAEKLANPANEDESRTFLTHMLNSTILGMLASKYVHLANCGFGKSVQNSYKKLNLNSDQVKHCSTTLYAVCSTPHYISLPKKYATNKYNETSAKTSSSQTTSFQESYPKKSSSSRYSYPTSHTKTESGYSSSAPVSSEIISALKSAEAKELMAEVFQSAQQQHQQTQQQAQQQYYQYLPNQTDQSYVTASYAQHYQQQQQTTTSPSTPVRDEYNYASYSQYT